MYMTQYETGLIGTLTLVSDGTSLTGCWFDNSRYLALMNSMKANDTNATSAPASLPILRDDLPVFDLTRAWLDRYFAAETPGVPDEMPDEMPDKMPDPRELPLGTCATPFQARVRQAMLDIPYGSTTTYGQIAKRIERETGKRQSAQAVGGAVGRNPLCVIVPCHRVVGADGNLTGFGGGIDKKIALLKHEHAMQPDFYRPDEK